MPLTQGCLEPRLECLPSAFPRPFSAEVTANTGKDAEREWDGGRERRGSREGGREGRQEGQCQDCDSVQNFPNV